MSNEKVLPPGTFCWIELATSDSEGARAFYAELLGWGVEDVDMGALGTYTLLQLDSNDIAGLYALSDEQKQRATPPHWLSYVRVEDADASVERVSELGGDVMVGPFDVPNVGRMAIVRDPTQAMFALFQTGDHQGAAPMDNRPGMFCWNELATVDPDRAKEFYTELFGWSAEDSEMGPSVTYTTFTNGGRLAGGMMKISEEMGDVPPNWTVYFAVDDCDTATETAKSAGATVVTPPADIPDIGRFSLIVDPQGASCALIDLNNPETN
jgi:hypothetical protein